MTWFVENRKDFQYSMNRIYKALSISKQAVHQRLAAHERYVFELKTLEMLVTEIRQDHPRMALRIIHKKLQPKRIGRDAFEAYFKREGFGVGRVRLFHRTTDSRGVTRFDNLIMDIKLRRINQVWVSDITYIQIGARFYYLTFILDSFSRKIVGHCASQRLFTDQTTIPALRMALKRRRINKNSGTQLIFHSDGGGQYYQKEFIGLLKRLNIRSSMAETVYENSKAERINGIIKNNYLNCWSIKTYSDLVKNLDRAVSLYNSEKPHKALDWLTPIAFEERCTLFALEQKTEGDEVIDGKDKMNGASSPIHLGNKKPQAQNVSMEIQV